MTTDDPIANLERWCDDTDAWIERTRRRHENATPLADLMMLDEYQLNVPHFRNLAAAYRKLIDEYRSIDGEDDYEAGLLRAIKIFAAQTEADERSRRDVECR